MQACAPSPPVTCINDVAAADCMLAVHAASNGTSDQCVAQARAPKPAGLQGVHEPQYWERTITWEGMPDACRADKILGDDGSAQQKRAERKRLQVASFALVLRQLLPDVPMRHCSQKHEARNAIDNSSGNDIAGSISTLDEMSKGRQAHNELTLVDFGSGAGSLTLPLAWHFPTLQFVAVDMKAEAIHQLQRRASEAGLSNVQTEVGTIEAYTCASLSSCAARAMRMYSRLLCCAKALAVYVAAVCMQ
jgi:Methyltransferase domain